MIPLKYNLRNMTARWVTTAVTLLCAAFVVWSSSLLFSLVDGFQHSLKISADPLDLIILRQGSNDETSSGIDRKVAETVAILGGIAKGSDGKPLASMELMNFPTAERMSGSRTNLIMRGVDPIAKELRTGFTIVEGSDLRPGTNDCLVSRRMSGRFKGTRVGETLEISGKEKYQVVGLFTSGGSASESEVWVNRSTLEQNTGREGSVSIVNVRAASPDDLDTLQAEIKKRVDLKLDPKREADYYSQTSSAMILLTGLGTIVAILLTTGAMFAAANTMYAAVASRTREIGTMRALGFSRRAILFSFLGECLILCAIGGLIGVLAVLPFNGYTVSTNNNFVEATFGIRIGWVVVTVAFAMTMAMGLFGGALPAIRAIRQDVIASLRQL